MNCSAINLILIFRIWWVSDFLQTILTAKNIVLATGGRPKYPSNVNITVILTWRGQIVYFFFFLFLLVCDIFRWTSFLRAWHFLSGPWSCGARHHQWWHLLAEEVSWKNVSRRPCHGLHTSSNTTTYVNMSVTCMSYVEVKIDIIELKEGHLTPLIIVWALILILFSAKEVKPLQRSRHILHTALLADTAHPAVTQRHHSSEMCGLFFSLPVSLSSPHDSD